MVRLGPSGAAGLSPCHRQQRGGPDTLFAFLTLPVIRVAECDDSFIFSEAGDHMFLPSPVLYNQIVTYN